MLKYIIIYLSAMSLLTFILFGADKHKAKAHKWRIPEKTLLGLSLLGGFAGGFLGMEFFRHKTKHWYFYNTDYDRSAGLVMREDLTQVLREAVQASNDAAADSGR